MQTKWYSSGLFLAALVMAACAGTDTEIGGFTIHHGYDFETEPIEGRIHDLTYPVIWESCLDTFWALELPVETAARGVIRSAAIEKGGLVYRLRAELKEDKGPVQISACMEIRRTTDYTSNHLDRWLDSALGIGFEEELEQLEKDYRHGRIDFPFYIEERNRLEMAIEREKEVRRAEWEEQDRIRIQRLTQQLRRFLPALQDRLIKAGGRFESGPVR